MIPLFSGHRNRHLLAADSTAGGAWFTEVWADEHAHWLKRDLSARHYVYFWADGIHVQARLEDDAQCLLVIIGATPEGKKELVGLIDGVRESAQSWRELLLDLKRRGLAVAPELAIADGALGFWKAIEEVWPRTRSQRCWVTAHDSRWKWWLTFSFPPDFHRLHWHQLAWRTHPLLPAHPRLSRRQR